MAKKRVMHEVKQKEGYNLWKISAIVLAVLFLASVLTDGFSTSKSKELPKSKVSDSTLDFINQYVLQGQAVATVEGIADLEGQDCLYNMTLDIQGQKFESYVTKDGAILFPQAINMKVITETPVEQQQQPASDEIPKTDKPEVLLFTMSYCPYGNQAETGIAPVVKAMGTDVEIQPHYVIYSNYQGGGPNYCLDNESKYCSMHGINELNQDVRELCIYKYYKAKFWDYILKVNSDCNVGNIEECWETPAKAFSIDTARIKTCQKNEAMALLAKEAELNSQHGVRGSPMLVINGAEYGGGRTPEAYKSSICSAFNTPPASCGTELSDQGAAATGSC